MPDHVHLILEEKMVGGISKYMSKVANSYTRYFNSRYDREGPLFAGRYKAVGITSKSQLVALSRYIHLGPVQERIVIDLKKFPFSSYLHHLGLQNEICNPSTITNNFESVDKYEAWILDHADYLKTLPEIEPIILEKLQKEKR
jgi:putative transposase